jgi:hypothetical protein
MEREVKMSKLKFNSKLTTDNGFSDSFLKDSAVAAERFKLSEFELTIDNTQEIEERVSKSFLAVDAFTTEINGGSGGCGGSGCGTGG